MCSMNNSFVNRNYTKIAGKPLIKKRKESCVYFNIFFAQNKRKLLV